MRILYKNELSMDDIDKSYHFIDLNMTDSKILELLPKLKDKNTLIDILNKINNQGITDINTIGMCYTVKDNLGEYALGFNNLSTAEKIFFVSYLFGSLDKILILSYGITQLSYTTFKLYYKIFKDNRNIMIVFEDENVASYYNRKITREGWR